MTEEQRTHAVPGTEILFQDGPTRSIAESSSNPVLVPRPSSHPHDPLNWSIQWKMYTTFSATFVSFAQGFGPLAIAPMFPLLAKEFQSDLPSVIQFTGVTILVLGFSNFIWIPLSLTFGRRPVLLASTLVSLASSIWKAKANSYHSFMGACILNGIGAGPGETLQPQIITDYIFLHDRGKYQTLYFVSYFGSLALSPVVAGLLAEHTSWRDFWWLNVALLGAAFLVSLVMFPETLYYRLETDKNTTDASETALQPKGESSEPIKIPIVEVQTEDQSPMHAGRPSKAQLRLFQPNPHALRSTIISLWTPIRLFTLPIVDFASFVVAWSASSFLAVNLTQAQAFSAPPQSYTPQKIGFFNFAVVIGLLIGLTAGPLSDWVSMRATRRKEGIREPEMRLPTLIPYALIMILGNLVVGLGYQYLWDWKAIVIVGYTCAGIQVAALPAIASTYAIDSYKPATGSIFVNITVVKNLWGYGLSKFISTWSEEDGFIAPIMTQMCLNTLWCLCGVIFWYYGKRLRTLTRDSKIHEM